MCNSSRNLLLALLSFSRALHGHYLISCHLLPSIFCFWACLVFLKTLSFCYQAALYNFGRLKSVIYLTSLRHPPRRASSRSAARGIPGPASPKPNERPITRVCVAEGGTSRATPGLPCSSAPTTARCLYTSLSFSSLAIWSVTWKGDLMRQSWDSCRKPNQPVGEALGDADVFLTPAPADRQQRNVSLGWAQPDHA